MFLTQSKQSITVGNEKSSPSNATPPTGSFFENLRFDVVSGLLVFLIALPLSLGIAGASGFPAINGVFTAIAGGVVCGLLSNSELTIKGPAAGMIAIVWGCVLDFAKLAGVEANNLELSIYMQYLPSVAAVAVVAGVIQIIFGLLKAGDLADLFPSSVIHGLLASIGLIIIGKQLYPLLGLSPNTSVEAYQAYIELPMHAPHLAWQVAIIGLASLGLLFAYPILKKSIPVFKIVPPQLIILVIAIPVSMMMFAAFEKNSRSYDIQEQGQTKEQVVKSLVVKVPDSAAKLPAAFIGPNFQHVGTTTFWYWVVMFTLVGSLESLLSAKAVDVLDPWKRKSDLNRDMLAVGIANTAVACIGGLPMISEIVRSSANKDFGARSRWSNFFHGLFLLISILVLPVVLNLIPLTALAAMLIYAGCRLAHYKQFLHMWHVGKEQFLIFISTIIGVLAIDLLWGVGIGIAVKFLVELVMGVRPNEFVIMPAIIEETVDKAIVSLNRSAVFTNWLVLKAQINKLSKDRDVVVDCSGAPFIDHTVMTRLDELKREYEEAGRSLSIVGLENHKALAHDPFSARIAVKPLRTVGLLQNRR
jgi:MFS superfamily sulfate permease-like transporter